MPQFRFNTISRSDIEESVGGNHMLLGIDYDGPADILVTGPPGSGKTTVSLMRAERLVRLRKSVLLITKHDLLWRSLTNIASDELKPNIQKFLKWFYRSFQFLKDYHTEKDMIEFAKSWKGVDEVIIDEGQDLEARVYRFFLTKSGRMTVGADNAQKVYRRGLSSKQIEAELTKRDEPLHVHLEYNYRNTFGIYDFARYFLPDNEIVNNELAIEKITKGDDGIKPTYFLVPDRATALAQLKILLDNAGDINTAVLLFNIDEVDYYADLIESIGFKCSRHHHDNHVGLEIENILVTTLQSAKGLEFQVVIMPNMETARNEDYKSAEHYFVACTRAKELLFLIGEGNKVPICMNDFDDETYELIKVEKMAEPPKVDKQQDDDDIFDLSF